MIDTKWKLAVVVLCSVLMVMAAGCAPDVAAPDDGGTAPPIDENGGGDESPSVPVAETIKWNLQTPYPEGSYLNQAARAVCDGITLASGGRINVEFFSAGNIVPAKGEFDALHQNVIQMSMTSFGYCRDKWPNGAVLDSKPGTMSHLGARMWWDTFGGIELGEELIEGYSVKLLRGPIVKTPEPFLHSREKIESLDDLRGLIVRSYGESGLLLERLGASVVYLAAGETYEAAQRGVIDAFELGTLAGNVSYSAHEVAKYVYLGSIRAPYSNGYFMVAGEEWEALSPDLKALVQAVVSTESELWINQQVGEDMEALQFFRDYGCEVYPIPQDVKDACIEEIDAMYAELAAEDPFLAKVLANLAQFEEAFNTAESLHKGA